MTTKISKIMLLNLSNVDNTSDLNKPISTATQTALNARPTSTTLASQTGTTLLGHRAPGTGGILRTVFDKLSDVVNAKDYGAIGNGVFDCTTAIQDALNTGKRVILDPGIYKVTNAVFMFLAGQVLQGSGRANTIILVDSSFNLSALGVIVFKDSDPWSNEIHDLGIRFVHTSTLNRAALTNFPPAISAVNHPRGRVSNVRIESAMTAIDWRGNSGGSTLFDGEISAFNHTIRLNGSLDTIRIDQLHQWPFGLNSSATEIFYDGNTVGIESGRCDGLTISNSLFIGKGKQLHLYAGSGSNTFATVTNTNFDSNPSILIEAGTVSLSSCMINAAQEDGEPIKLTGGSDSSLRVDGCEFKVFYNMDNPVVSVVGTAGVPDVTITDNKFYVYGDATLIGLSSSGGTSTATVTGNNFFLPVNTTPTKDLISVDSSARIIFAENRASDKGSGTGTFISILDDNYHIVRNNIFSGWQIDIPVSWNNMSVGGNSGIGNGDFTTSGYVRGSVIERRFVGSADGSGVVTITHGIGQGNYKIIAVHGYYKGGSGEMKPLVLDYVDATNIRMTGAGAGDAYRVTIEWTVTDHVW